MRTVFRLSIVYLALVVASNAAESGSRSFEGVIATFRITNPTIKPGEKLKVVTVYHNTGVAIVHFPFTDPSHFSEIFRKGEPNHVTGYYIGTPFVQEVTLKPSESVEFKEEVDLRAWEDLSPGDYEIQFCFHVAMLPEARQEEYLKKFPHDGLVVPWSDQRYQFTIAKRYHQQWAAAAAAIFATVLIIGGARRLHRQRRAKIQPGCEATPTV